MTLIKSVSGIRGVIGGNAGEGLTPEDIVVYASAYAQWILQTGRTPKVVIGRDGRISGSMVRQIVNGTLQGMGMEVVDADLTTTPTLAMAIPAEQAGGGIMITASHNPVQWNALKLMNEKGYFLSQADGEMIYDIAEKRSYSYANVHALGSCHTVTTFRDYHINSILNLPLVDREAIKKKKLKVVVDCVNSTGGLFVPPLLDALGIENTTELFCAPNGRFPHTPEPLPENLETLANEVRFQKADVGFAVDPDADRLAIVCEDGSFFGEEYTLVAVADYVLQHKKGPVVANLSTTRALEKIAEKYDCPYFASAVGEVHVVEKMLDKQAVIGGEGNGGVIYPELHAGRDALVGIALFLSHLARSGKSVSRLRNSYPDFHMVKNKITLDPEVNLNNVLEALQKQYKKYPIDNTDGLKISFDDDWVHLRKSNTEPIIRIYAESTSENTAKNLAEKLIVDIKNLIKEKA